MMGHPMDKLSASKTTLNPKPMLRDPQAERGGERYREGSRRLWVGLGFWY